MTPSSSSTTDSSRLALVRGGRGSGQGSLGNLGPMGVRRKEWGEPSKILRCGLVIRERNFLGVIHRKRPVSGNRVNTEILIGDWERARDGFKV